MKELLWCIYCRGKGVVRGPLALAPCPNVSCPNSSAQAIYTSPILHMDIQLDILRIQRWKAEREQILKEAELIRGMSNGR